MILSHEIGDRLNGIWGFGGEEVGTLACGQRANFIFGTQRARCVPTNCTKCLRRQQLHLRASQGPNNLQTRNRTAPRIEIRSHRKR